MPIPVALQLTKLLQLASPALPVGAFSYSQGLESAVEAGIVHDAADTQRWIADVLALSLARMEAQGLVETGPGTVRLTRRGRLLQNAVMQQVMDFA